MAACLAGVSFWAACPVQADSFTFEDWDLSVGVQAMWPDMAAAFFDTIQNPFVGQHAVTLPSNSATRAAAQYDISWVMDFASFSIASQLSAQDGKPLLLTSRATSLIVLQADADLAFHVDALLNYNLPSYGLDAEIGFAAHESGNPQAVFGEDLVRSTFVDPIGPGTLSFSGDFVLSAGHTCGLSYRFGLVTDGFSTGLAEANGQLDFSFQVVPEPATALPAALALLAVSYRRHRRRG